MTVVASTDDRVGRTGPAGGLSTAERITVWSAADASLLRVHGGLRASMIPLLQQALGAAVARHAWTIVDLSLVNVIDRIALNTLVKVRCTARGRGGDLLLVASHNLVRAALEAARMSTAFCVFPTVPQALSAVPANGYSLALTAREPGDAGHR